MSFNSSNLIEDTSAEGIALALSRMGIVGTVSNSSAGTSYIELRHGNLHYQVFVFTSDDQQHRCALFSATFNVTAQYWDAQAWCEKHVFGRIIRERDGAATVQHALPLDGISERLLRSFVETWSHTLEEFKLFCEARTDRRSP